MFGPRCFLFGLVDDLSEEHRAKLSTKAYPAGDAREPGFCRAAERARQKYRCLEASTYLLGNGQKRILRREGDDLINLRNRLPESFKFGRSQDGKAGVWSAALKGAHGTLAHDRVSEPVRRAHNETKRVERRWVRSPRQEDTALLSGDEEIGPWCFP